MKKTTKHILASLLIASTFLTACGTTEELVYGDNSTPVSNGEESSVDPRLALISPTAYGDVSGLNLTASSVISILSIEKSSNYWALVKDGAQQAIDDINKNLGYSGKDVITLSYNTPSSADNVEEMINLLDYELSRYPAAIGIAISDPYAYGMQFDQALENGIPVVAFETSSKSNTLSSTVAMDVEDMTTTAVEKLFEGLEEEATLFIITSESNSLISSDKIAKIAELMDNEYENITTLEIFDVSELEALKNKMLADRTWVQANLSGNAPTIAANPNHEDYEALLDSISPQQVLTYVLSKNPTSSHFITLDGDSHDLLMELLDGDYNDVEIVSFGNGDSQLEDLENGTIKGLMVPNPFGMGYAAVIAAARGALDMANEALVNPGSLWVDQEAYTSGDLEGFLY